MADHDREFSVLAAAMRRRSDLASGSRNRRGVDPDQAAAKALAQEARFGLFLVSDSNARLPPDALEEVVAHFQDPAVACVTHPVSGSGHRSFGALLDNLHLAASVGAAQLAAKALAGQDLVVGKSMALRRSALDRLGGFGRYVDVLAEDYVIGQDLRRRGFALRVARTPVWNVAVTRSVRSFFERYLRWGVIHRTAVSAPVSFSQGLLNPLPVLGLACACSPSPTTAGLFAAGALLKTALDLSSARALGCQVPLALALPAVLVKDALLFVTWAHGLFARSVVWRGQRLRVGRRSQLLRPTRPLPPAHAEAS